MKHDLLIRAGELPWVELGDGASAQYLRNCEITGQWVQILRLNAGASLPSHYHFGAGEFIVLKGELHYAAGIAKSGDYGYEPLGAVHEKTYAPVDTELFYVGYGPLAALGADGKFTGVMIDGLPPAESAVTCPPLKKAG